MGDVFLISFVSVTLAAIIGVYIRNKIWGLSNKPKTPNEYGRAWAAYAAFTSVLVSTPRFIHQEFELALIQLLIVILVYPTIAYVVGSLYGLRKISNQPRSQESTMENVIIKSPPASKNNPLITSKPTTYNNQESNYLKKVDLGKDKEMAPSIDENNLWEIGVDEFDGVSRKKGLWAKAFAEADGDENKAKANYLKVRVAELKLEVSKDTQKIKNNVVVQAQNIDTPQKEENSNLNSKEEGTINCPMCRMVNFWGRNNCLSCNYDLNNLKKIYYLS